MREVMRKEITKSTVKFGRVTMVKGVPTLSDVQEETVLGNLTGGKALDHVKKTHGEGLTVFEVVTSTEVYEAKVLDFLSIATKIEVNVKPETPETPETV